MSTDPERPPNFAVPRPGILRSLGIANIIFALMNVACVFSMTFWYVVALVPAPAPTVIQVDAPKKVKSAGVPKSAMFNPLLGMDDKKFVRFGLVENGVSVLVSGLMFTTGIGLLNLRRWAASGWFALAWTKIALHVLFWGYYIVAVAPSFSEHMAREVMKMFAQQGAIRGQGPTLEDMTRIYSIMNLIIAVSAIVISSVYPAISVWVLSRPGVKAAIVDQRVMEPKLP